MPGVTATPLKGADRIATAALISAKLTNPAGSFVVGYDALADALSVASFAAANNYSILVANTDGSLPASEGAYKDAHKDAHKGAHKGAKVYTVGGDTLVADIAGATRLAGADRFATNKVVLDTLGYSYNKAYVANGTDAHLVDSLVASSLAALAGAPIVLTDTATGGDATAADIGAKLDDNAVVVALGGDTVVTATTLAKVTSPSTTPTAPVIPSVTVLTADEQLMVDTINQERIDAGLNPVIADLRLTAVGRAKANDMKVNNYFSHTSPTYGSPWVMMQQVGLTVKWAGENISGNKSVSGSMAALMLSPGHRANILDPRFTHVGVGIAYGSAYGNLYVQEFLQE